MVLKSIDFKLTKKKKITRNGWLRRFLIYFKGYLFSIKTTAVYPLGKSVSMQNTDVLEVASINLLDIFRTFICILNTVMTT